MIPQNLDFKYLKSYVSIEMVLAAKGLLPPHEKSRTFPALPISGAP